MNDAFDVMQVCINGHMITSSYRQFPTSRKNFCDRCGEPTTIKCSHCNESIKGFEPGSLSFRDPEIPSYCDSCGLPYPWQASKISNTLELLKLNGVTQDNIDEIEVVLPELIKDTPRSQSSALKIRNILKPLAKPISDIAIKIIVDLAPTIIKSFGS